MAGRFTIEAVFKGIDRITAPITRMGNRVGKAMRKMGAAVSSLNARMKTLRKTSSSALGIGGVAGAAFLAQRALASVVTTGADFEKALVGAGSRFTEPVLRGTAAFERLEASAREAGATTEFTAVAAAGALNFMAKASRSAEQSIALLIPAIDFATASELELARATDIITDALEMFDLLSDNPLTLAANFKRMSDVMLKATTGANINIEQLFETMRKGGKSAKEMGADLETFVTLAARLSAVGKGEVPGIALKNLFLRLSSKSVQNDLDDMRVKLATFEDGSLDFVKTLDRIRDALADVDPITRAGVVNQLFGLRAVTAGLTLLGQKQGTLTEFSDRLREATGFTRELALELRDTRDVQLDVMNSALTSLNLTFSAINHEGIGGMIQGLTDVTRKMDLFVAKHPTAVRNTTAFFAIVLGAIAIGVVVATIVAGVAFIAGSTVALAVTVGVITAGFLAWLNPLNRIEQWFERFMEADYLGKFKAIAGVMLQFGAGGFAGGLAGALGSAIGKSEGDVVSPQERLADTIEEKRRTSTAELIIKGDTAGTELVQTNKVPGIGISVAESGGT